MATFAVIDNYRVVNKIVAESKIDAENITKKDCVLIDDVPCDIGWDYIDGIFVKPIIPIIEETATTEPTV